MAKREKEEYREKCLRCELYPFSLVLESKTIEMVATDFYQFKFVSEGLEELARLKSYGALGRLAKKFN